MRPSDISPSLPADLRFRADVVALCIGLIPLAVAPVLLRYSSGGQPTGMMILLLIVSLALAAGFATVAHLNRVKISSSDATYLVRAGARAGLLAATLAAAMTVLSVRLSHSQMLALLVLVPAVLSILPGSFFGMLATALAVGIWTPAPAATQPSPRSPSPRRVPLMLLLAIACIVGFSSVLIPQKAWESGIQAKGSVPPNLPTPWKYEKPPDLGAADAARWELIATRTIGRVQNGSPLALSPAGDRLAYLDAEQANVLKVVELNQPERSSSFNVTAPPTTLAFSPNGTQILFHTSEGGHRVAVADLPKARVIILPRPKGGAVPTGDIIWSTPTKAVFRSGGSAVLDLDMLEITAAKKGDEPAGLSLPTTARAVFEFRRAIFGAEVPSNPNQKEWPMTGAIQLSIKDTQNDYRRFFQVDSQAGDRFLASADATKIIRIRNNAILVAYFGSRARPPVAFTLEMSKRPEEHGDKTKIAAALSSGELCALVYAPLINPLNDKVIGPDRSRVKGLVRFSTWSERNASVWLTEEFQSIALNDVIADLHVWQNYHAELIVDSEPRRWWTKIAAIAPQQLEITSVPAQSSTKAMQRSEPYDLVADSNALTAPTTTFKPPREAPAPVETIPSWLPSLPAEARPLSPNEPAFQEVAAFIAAHHQKANSGDLNALIEDYAESVVFFDKGTVDKAYILRNEAISRSPFRQMSESIIYPIRIQQAPPNRFGAEYQIAWEAIKKDGRRSNGIANVYLALEQTSAGLKIVDQQSNLESGE